VLVFTFDLVCVA